MWRQMFRKARIHREHKHKIMELMLLGESLNLPFKYRKKWKISFHLMDRISKHQTHKQT